MKKYGSVKIVSREYSWVVKEYSQILSGDLLSFGNILINLNEDRLTCFKVRGLSCAGCNKKGEIFALEYIKSKSYEGYSLNLYSSDGTYFTKDHIIPKSLGGKDSIQNYQTMCWKCNSLKGSKILI
jgi:hypothetical protein